MRHIKYIRTSSFLLLTMFIVTLFAVEEGTLTVTTDPEGVEVWLDDKYVGDSPIENRKLRAGRYTIKLVDPVQQVSTSEEILIQAGELTVVEKSLKAKFGTLKVTSEPEGADVFISTSLGKTPVENNFMNPGKYRIEIKHPKRSYIPVVEEVTIPAGKKVELTNTLARKSAFDTKAVVRLLLGVGAIGGFVWAIVDQGNHEEFETTAEDLENWNQNDPEIEKNQDKAKSAAVRRTIGIILGSACVVGFEIVAFF